ncbi:MAG TPA: hypothetical protein VFO70_05435, partial [Chitinophagaceae bacterium]|nr:hypothetical protein [Chitinophagaceae bacterium]
MPPLYTEAQHPLQVFPSQRERGSVAETLQFKKIQEGFPRQFEHIDGIYDQKQGLYLTYKGNLVRYYFCFNNLHNEWYR